MKKLTIPETNINLIIETVSENVEDEIPQVSLTRTYTEEELERRYDQCFYCDGLIKRSSKNCGDHFPIPKRNGGTLIVPCCQSCHLMKDSFNLQQWPVDWIAQIITDFPKVGRETRIFLAKAVTILSDYAQRIRKLEEKERLLKG